MANPQNESVVRRTIELTNQPQLPPDYDQLFDPDYDVHASGPPIRGPQGYKEFHESMHAGFPDVNVTIEKILSDGDLVAAVYRVRGTHTGEFQGMPPTGKTVDITGTAVYRCHSGRVAEAWVYSDQMGMLQQMGLAPEIGQPQQRAA